MSQWEGQRDQKEWSKELEAKNREWEGKGELVPQEIEFCNEKMGSVEKLVEWVATFSWGARVRVEWDTFREQLIVPPFDEPSWSREEFRKIMQDLRNHKDVTYAHPAGPKDST